MPIAVTQSNDNAVDSCDANGDDMYALFKVCGWHSGDTYAKHWVVHFFKINESLELRESRLRA